MKIFKMIMTLDSFFQNVILKYFSFCWISVIWICLIGIIYIALVFVFYDPRCSPDKQDFDREFINFPMNSCEGKARQAKERKGKERKGRQDRQRQAE